MTEYRLLIRFILRLFYVLVMTGMFISSLHTMPTVLAMAELGRLSMSKPEKRPAPVGESRLAPERPASLKNARASAPALSPAGRNFLFGVVNDEGDHYDDLWQRGVRAVTFELQWKFYEPQQGVFDHGYIEHMKDLLVQINRQGWYVQLVPGYHYAPDWVFQNYPSAYFVNQYGDRYDPDPVAQGDFRVANAPFNPHVRDLLSAYLEQIFLDFDQSNPDLLFDSVRIGGGPQGELRYPPPVWNGHTNSYWAFDSSAQDAAVSGIPSIVGGWRPGIDENPGTTGRGQLIVNPGFEREHPNFPIFAWSPDDEVAAQIIPESHSGEGSLSLTISTPNRVHQYLRVSPNTKYAFGGWLWPVDGHGSARILVTQYDALTRPISGASFAKLESWSPSWQEVTGELTTAGSTALLKFELDGDRPGNYRFDDLWLTKEGETNHQDRDVDVPLAFYDWYVDRMTQYELWQIAEMRKYYGGQIDVVLAGKGVRPNQISGALTNDLRGDGWSEASSGLYSAADYDRHISALPEGSLAVYLTGIEDPSPDHVDDQSPYPGDWSSARWLSHLSRKYGFPIWGENTGDNSKVELLVSVDRMRNNGFAGLMWAHESDLYGDPDVVASADDYEHIIAYFSQLSYVYLPIALIGP